MRGRVKGGLAGLVMATLVTAKLALPAAAQELTCNASQLFYSNAEYMALTSDTEKRAFAARTATQLWGPVTGEIAKMGGVFGMGQGLGALAIEVTGGNTAIEKAMTLSADSLARHLKGRTYTVGRVRNVLRTMQTGAPPGAGLATAFTAIGVVTDVVNVINHALNTMNGGEREDRAKAAQAALSLSRTGLGAGWGGAMGPMMAMAGFLDYSINAFGTKAYAEYDAYWYNGYKGFHNETQNHTAARWLEIYEAEGRRGIRARLDTFWDDPVYNAATYQDARTIAGDALAGAEFREEFARRYMIEVIEPKIAAAFEQRARQTMYAAMDDFEAQCETALEEARALAAAQALLDALDEGVSAAEVYDAVLEGDMDRLNGYIDAGFDPNNPADYDPGDDDLRFMYLIGAKMVEKPQMKAGVRRLVAAGAVTNITDSDHPGPVVLAVRQNNARAARALIDLGYPVDHVWDNGQTLVAEAARLGMRDVVAALLDRGVDPDGAGGEGAALLHAAAEGHAGIVTDLLARGSDVNVTTHQGATGLHLAARDGHGDIVRILIEAGADTGMTIGSRTAAEVARDEGHLEIARYLDELDAGPPGLTARVSRLVPPGQTGEVVLMMDGGWQRPLTISVRADAPHLIDIQAEGLDESHVTRSMIPEEKGRLYLEVWFDALSEGSTDLTITVSDASGHAETVTHNVMIGDGYSTYRGRLIEAARGYDPQAIRDVISDINEMDAALDNDPSWLSQVFREDCVRGSAQDCQAYLGSFIAFHVAGTSDEALLDFMLEWGADANYAASGGDTILVNASASGNWGQVAQLLAAGADPNAMRANGATPLLYAVGAGQTGLVREMLDLGADPNAGSVTSGMTPLHHAAANNSIGIIDLLLGAGAEIYYDDDDRVPGWFSYWEHDNLGLALTLGYHEAQDYEDRANEPEITSGQDPVIIDDEGEIETWADPVIIHDEGNFETSESVIIHDVPDDKNNSEVCRPNGVITKKRSGTRGFDVRLDGPCGQYTAKSTYCGVTVYVFSHSDGIKDALPSHYYNGTIYVKSASGEVLSSC